VAKDLNVLYIKDQIQDEINSLDKDKIHILYFSYYFNFHNIWQNPLLLLTKLLNLFNGDKSIDHVNHIARFRFDEEDGKWVAKVFEATMERGMEQNDLFDKLKLFQGICYIETIDKKVDKVKAKAFENKYYGVPYSKELAGLSGIDIDSLDKIIKQPKTDGGFCSWLEALFLIDQGINISHIENGNPLEITPVDLFNGNLGNKRILFKR
jgi:hypothetical protein